jgi:hypothetical protein
MGEEVNRVSVYGDDIIVPSAAAGRLAGLLEYLGFTPNAKKSYATGPFRESCGKHYYLGHDITPFYVKRAPKTLVDLFKIHNQLFRYLNRMSEVLSYEQKSALHDVCAWLRRFAPAAWRRPKLVDGLGDGAFVGYLDGITPPTSKQFDKRRRLGWDGYWFESIVVLPNPEHFEAPGLLIKALGRLESIRPSSDLVESGCHLLHDDDSQAEVLPVKGQRHASTLIFARRGYVHEQYALR